MAEVGRVLVVVAHPDDVDFGCAGTVAAWTDAGLEVAYCVVTDGDAGGFDPDVPREEIPGIRRGEQRAAAAVVGVEDVSFLGYPDGRLYVTHELRRDVTRVIRRFRPERVVLQSPERNWQRIGASHPDHLAAGEAALCAVYPDARNPFTHKGLLRDEGLEPHAVGEVWVMASPEGAVDRYVDVTDTYERKLDAIRSHGSQLQAGRDLDAMLRGWLRTNAVRAGLPDGRLAEGFRTVDTT